MVVGPREILAQLVPGKGTVGCSTLILPPYDVSDLVPEHVKINLWSWDTLRQIEKNQTDSVWP